MATAQSSTAIEADALTHLEERIQKTVALVSRLREEKDVVTKELAHAQADNAQLSASHAQMHEELNALRAEKMQVRDRLEKLLGHIDQLGGV